MNSSHAKRWSSQVWMWLGIAALIALALLYYALSPSPIANSAEQKADRSAIKDCWKRHQNSPLSPTELKFVAEACEFMENEFILKYRQHP